MTRRDPVRGIGAHQLDIIYIDLAPTEENEVDPFLQLRRRIEQVLVLAAGKS